MKLATHRALTRRQFLGLGLGALFVLVLSYLLTLWRRYQLKMGYDWARIADYAGTQGRELAEWSRQAHLSAEERIQRHFGYLTFEPGTVEAFVRDYERHHGRLRRFVPPPNPEETVFNRFLLSTDFFLKGADESQSVHYVLFYDPYVNPCWNPCLPVAG